MDVHLVRSSWLTVECDALFVPLFEEDLARGALASEIDSALDGLLTEVQESGELTGKQGETVTVYRPGNLKCRRLVLVGSGKESRYASASIRSILMRAVVKTRTSSLKTLAVYRHSFENPPVAAQAALEGLILGSWNSALHKTQSRQVRRPEKVLLVFNGQPMDDSFLRKVEHRAEVMASATNLARAWADEPGNIVSPTQLAERARELAHKAGLEIEIWDEQRLEKEGMNSEEKVKKIHIFFLGKSLSFQTYDQFRKKK